jgi:hypothetical protein
MRATPGSAGDLGFGAMAHPVWGTLLERILRPAMTWLLKQLGGEWVLRRLEQAVDRITDRQKAIGKARSLSDGRFGAVIIEDRARYVVYSGDEPRAIFASIQGDLDAELRGYDTTRLRRPDELTSARARAWASQRFRDLRDRLRRGEADMPEVQDSPRTGPGDERRGTELVAIEQQAAKVGADAFDRITGQMPSLLNQLTACEAKPAARHSNIPAAPGIYLFSEGPTPLYVGNTRNLRQRLRQDTGENSGENEAALAWRIALKDAQKRKLAIKGTRKEIEADAAFAEVFRDARQRVAAMDVRFIEIDDAMTRTILEVYAAQALGTDEFNSFETH